MSSQGAGQSVHFRQAVLSNMRGTGEPVFEFDFPPGSDMTGEGPKVAERMEFEFLIAWRESREPEAFVIN